MGKNIIRFCGASARGSPTFGKSGKSGKDKKRDFLMTDFLDKNG